jgi:hypothetical protein
MSPRVLQVFLVFLGVAWGRLAPSVSAEPAAGSAAFFSERYSLYDISPQASDNPVVARAADDSFTITRAEFRGFLASTERGDPALLDEKQKRQWLNDLIAEHLLLSRAYAERLDQLPKVVDMMAETQRLLLKKALINRELGDRPKTDDAFDQKSKELEETFFRAHPIEVSGDALVRLKGDLRRPYSEIHDAQSNAKPGEPLARSKERVVTEEEFVTALREGTIGPVDEQELKNAVMAFARERLGDEFVVDEARRRGLDRADDVCRALQLNRNTLVYMEVNNRLMEEARKSFAALKNPEAEMKTWFEANRAMIVHRDRSDQPLALSWEKDREVIQDWFMEHLRDEARRRAAEPWRSELKIEVNDKNL